MILLAAFICLSISSAYFTVGLAGALLSAGAWIGVFLFIRYNPIRKEV